MRGRKDPRSNLPFKSISEPNPILHERRLSLVTLAPWINFLPLSLRVPLQELGTPDEQQVRMGQISCMGIVVDVRRTCASLRTDETTPFSRTRYLVTILDQLRRETNRG